MTKFSKTLLNNLKREKFLSIANIVAMTVSFLILGIFICIVFVSQSTLKYLENQAQIVAFFKDTFSQENILSFKSTLEKDERISSIKYVSKEDAFKIFTEANKEDPILLESISSDILPASLEIKTKDVADLSAVASEIEKSGGVEEVKFYEDVIERFRNVSRTVYIIGLSLVGLLFLISYSVILATLRMTISSKGTELEIQKLVGASDSYVKSPLVAQGLFFGVVSALIASVVLMVVGVAISASDILGPSLAVPFLSGATIKFSALTLVVSFLLILSGAVLGYVGSWSAVKKYLNY